MTTGSFRGIRRPPQMQFHHEFRLSWEHQIRTCSVSSGSLSGYSAPAATYSRHTRPCTSMRHFAFLHNASWGMVRSKFGRR